MRLPPTRRLCSPVRHIGFRLACPLSPKLTTHALCSPPTFLSRLADPLPHNVNHELTRHAVPGRWSASRSVGLDIATLAAGKRHGVELLEELGRGMFGRVFRGAPTRITRKYRLIPATLSKLEMV